MSDGFDAFNEQVKSETEPELAEKPDPDEVKEGSDREEEGSSSHEVSVSDVEVVGDDNDRLRVSAETDEGTQVTRELPTDEAGKIMSFLGITDARNLEGETAIVWEDESGSRLEFETPM